MARHARQLHNGGLLTSSNAGSGSAGSMGLGGQGAAKPNSGRCAIRKPASLSRSTLSGSAACAGRAHTGSGRWHLMGPLQLRAWA
jgi:hypothetical protein